MRKLKNDIWNFYLKLPVEPKINKIIFYHRLARFIKKHKPKKIRKFYDFIFLKIIKDDILKWAKIFEKKQILNNL